MQAVVTGKNWDSAIKRKVILTSWRSSAQLRVGCVKVIWLSYDDVNETFTRIKHVPASYNMTANKDTNQIKNSFNRKLEGRGGEGVRVFLREARDMNNQAANT